MTITRNSIAFHKDSLWKLYDALKEKKLSLDMTRGKPCPAQLSLSWDMLRITSTHTASGIDCWNYGHLEGLPEARALCARYLGTNPKYTIAASGGSLSLMAGFIEQALLRGLPGWKAPGVRLKVLCPTPGYDRHHAICELYGMEMISVPMRKKGPDMRVVRKLVRDPSVVAMWCSPKYHNPTGITWSPKIVRALANMSCACPGFRLLWDNAYAVHDFGVRSDYLESIMRASLTAGTEDRPILFGSFSKVTFASGGISFMGMSGKNFDWLRKSLFVQTIGPDKLNQLRHMRFLKNMPGIRAHMRKHAHIVAPKFAVVDEVLMRELGGKGIAKWNVPRGGYFISLYMEKGSAKRVVELAGNLGVKLTPAGAAFPYGRDPDDSHIRIAPTFPDIGELRLAAEVLVLCAKIAHFEKWPQESIPLAAY